MLPKKNRANKKSIEKIFKEGRFVSSPNLTFKFINNTIPSTPQISFIVPKTTSKKAVVRNLLRRRGYAVLQKYFKTIPPSTLGAFVFGKKGEKIFGVRKNKENNPIQNLENEIKTILNKLH